MPNSLKRSNNLFEGWIVDEMSVQHKKAEALTEAYKSLKNKDTEYAKGIKSMLELREAIFLLCATFKTKRGE